MPAIRLTAGFISFFLPGAGDIFIRLRPIRGLKVLVMYWIGVFALILSIFLFGFIGILITIIGIPFLHYLSAKSAMASTKNTNNCCCSCECNN